MSSHCFFLVRERERESGVGFSECVDLGLEQAERAQQGKSSEQKRARMVEETRRKSCGITSVFAFNRASSLFPTRRSRCRSSSVSSEVSSNRARDPDDRPSGTRIMINSLEHVATKLIQSGTFARRSRLLAVPQPWSTQTRHSLLEQ